MAERRERPRMTPFRAALLRLLDRYLAPGESASPLEVQKLLYFLQEAGAPLKLKFAKQRYGPYADAARYAVLSLEGHFVTGFGDGTGPGDVYLLAGAQEEAAAFLADHPETPARHDRVAALIDGFETPYGLELLATTHWVAFQDHAADPRQAAELVRTWSHRKCVGLRPLSDGYARSPWFLVGMDVTVTAVQRSPGCMGPFESREAALAYQPRVEENGTR
jgi:hypothetical protein